MTDRWHAARYLDFSDDRLRPACDLLAHVPLNHARTIVDLGCGPGTVTALLTGRFPGADICGIDTSQSMLSVASRRLPGVEFIRQDIATWQPAAPPDLIFSNAALHWVADHSAVLPRLAGFLKPGGWLAVQMPDSGDQSSHRIMRAIVDDPRWYHRLNAAEMDRTTPAAPSAYYDWLAPCCDGIDIWRTTYIHRLSEPGAIVEWMRGAALTPYLSRLDEAMTDAFVQAYAEQIGNAYRPQSDGTVLFPYKRLFIVARRRLD